MNPMDDGAVPSLPDPPFFSHLLFETPNLVLAVLVLAGMVTAFLLFRRGRQRLGLCVVSGCVLAAVALFVLSRAVRTDRETLMDLTERLVQAAATGTAGDITAMLDERVSLQLLASKYDWNRETIALRASGEYRSRYGISDVRIGEVRASVDGAGFGTTMVRVGVRADVAGYQVPSSSWWRVQWVCSGDGPWSALSLECLWIQGMSSAAEVVP